IASIIVMDPDILVLDEPTSNLDPRGVDDLIEIISYIRARNKTLVIATHDMDFAAEILERCYILDGGRIVGEGGCESVLTDMNLLEQHGLKSPTVTRIFSKLGGLERLPFRLKDAVDLFKKLRGQ
ncbi:MAG: energy-coupling factor ABC transporter ATP-binding protein, partial [Candidatus Odinarchaeota archaeon]